MSVAGYSRPASASRGMTLIEVVTSMAVMTLLLGGIASAVIIASHALPKRGNPALAAAHAAAACGRLTSDLAMATGILERTSRSITCQVFDRDGDENPETIRYAWSGQAGDPLVRCYNGLCVPDFLEDVREFTLLYTTQATTVEGTPSPMESPQTVLAEYDNNSDTSYFSVTTTSWIGQYFMPFLPNNTVNWKVTKARLVLKHSGIVDGSAAIQLRSPTSTFLPSTQIVEEVSFPESRLAWSSRWEEFNFTHTGGLSPQQGLCIVLLWRGGFVGCVARYRDEDASLTNSHMVRTTTGGLAWSKINKNSLHFEVYGTITTTGAPQVEEVRLLTGTNITLQTGNSGSSRIVTGVQLLNDLEVTDP